MIKACLRSYESITCVSLKSDRKLKRTHSFTHVQDSMIFSENIETCLCYSTLIYLEKGNGNRVFVYLRRLFYPEYPFPLEILSAQRKNLNYSHLKVFSHKKICS